MSAIPVAAVVPLAVVAVAFVAFCLVDLVRQREVRYLPKPVWALITLISIPLGGIIYLTVGRSFPARDSGHPA